MTDRIVFIAPRASADGKAAFEYVVTYESGRFEVFGFAGNKLLADMTTLQEAASDTFSKRNG